MVELTVGDLFRWEPVPMDLVGSLEDQEEALDAEFSWAVGIRSTPPVLPALRGKEVVVAPASVLDELERNESIHRDDVAGHLRTLPVSAVITDDVRLACQLEGLVVIEIAAGHSDLETTLNRDFIERRADLYQLGTELARTFSAASIGGSDLDVFLQLATSRTGIPLVLQSLTGRVLATSSAGLEAPSGVVGTEHAERRIAAQGRDWVVQPVSGAGLPDGVVLVAEIAPNEPADRARLVLEHTGDALGLMFDRLPPIDIGSPRQEAGEILSGLTRTGALTVAAGRHLARLARDIDLESELRLLIDTDQPDQPLSEPALPFLVNERWLGLVDEAGYARVVTGRLGSLIVSRSFVGLERLPGAVREMQAAFRQSRAGRFGDGNLDLGRPGSGGALGMLIAAGAVSEGDEEQFGRYSTALLGDLDAYDRTRDMRLVETLGAYLDAGGSVAVAAGRLRIHRNTLAYRIARIIEVSGHDLADPAVRFDLQLAVAIRRLQSI